MSFTDTDRVAYVTKRYPRFSETFIVNEILAHEAAGFHVDVFALRPATEMHFQDILAKVRAPVSYIPEKPRRASQMWALISEARRKLPLFWRELGELDIEDGDALFQAIHLALEIDRRGITHLHAHFATVATVVTRLAARFTGISYSFTAHAKDIFHDSVETDHLRRHLRDASVAITVSDFNLDHLRRICGVDAARVSRVYNGLDLERFPYHAPKGRPRHILAVGRLVEKKGFHVLVDACAILRDRGVDFTCAIVGEGEEEARLRAQIHGLGMDEAIALIGPLPQADVVKALEGAAVFAAPCIVGEDGNRDGLPTVLLEAMAKGAPCISTDVTGIPELLEDDASGLMVPQHDPIALADALERLLGDEALQRKLADTARARIERDFDIHANARTLRELIASASMPAPALLKVAS